MCRPGRLGSCTGRACQRTRGRRCGRGLHRRRAGIRAPDDSFPVRRRYPRQPLSPPGKQGRTLSHKMRKTQRGRRPAAPSSSSVDGEWTGGSGGGRCSKRRCRAGARCGSGTMAALLHRRRERSRRRHFAGCGVPGPAAGVERGLHCRGAPAVRQNARFRADARQPSGDVPPIRNQGRSQWQTMTWTGWFRSAG